MSKELVAYLSWYIEDVIVGFESGLYKMVLQTQRDKLKLMASRHNPFITIFRDLHEEYYTTTFNSIISRNDKFIVDTFDTIKRLSNHSNQCMLNILSNIIVSIHFNLDRKKLNFASYDSYMKSLRTEIFNTVSCINIANMFNHECHGLPDDKLIPIPAGEKFIKIELSKKENGVTKKINSFSDK